MAVSLISHSLNILISVCQLFTLFAAKPVPPVFSSLSSESMNWKWRCSQLLTTMSRLWPVSMLNITFCFDPCSSRVVLVVKQFYLGHHWMLKVLRDFNTSQQPFNRRQLDPVQFRYGAKALAYWYRREDRPRITASRICQYQRLALNV